MFPNTQQNNVISDCICLLHLDGQPIAILSRKDSGSTFDFRISSVKSKSL